MAEGDLTFYNSGYKHLIDKDIDWLADDIRVMLLDNNYTLNIDTHEFIDDVSANEIVAVGYTAEGALLGTKTTTVDTTNDLVKVDAANVVWAALATATIRAAIIYMDSGTPGTSPLIAHMAITTNSDGTDYTINWNASGIFTISQA